MKISRLKTLLLAIAGAVIGARSIGIMFATNASAQEVLPTPAAPFKGQIGLRPSDSKPDFPQPVQAPKGAPNILLVLLDDVGFGAASTFGGPINTPTLERLAQNGLRYNEFHTTALCSPRRAADRTQPSHGSYWRHHGSRHWLSRLRHPYGQGHRDLRGGSKADGLEHSLVRQEPQRARLAEQPSRPIRSVADRAWF